MKPPPWIKPDFTASSGMRVTMIDRTKGEITINDTLIIKVGSDCLYFEVGMYVTANLPPGSSIRTLHTPFVKP